MENIYNIVCFIDDNPGKIGKSIEGIPVLNPSAITPQYLKKKKNQGADFRNAKYCSIKKT